MDIYVKFGDVKGDATHASHQEWIRASSLCWGVEREVSTEIGAPNVRIPSHPTVSEVTLIKEMDGATASLFREATMGQRGKTCLIDVCSDAQRVYCHFELQNALVSSVSLMCQETADGEQAKDVLREEVKINFTKIIFRYIIENVDDADGDASTTMFDYDIATAKS